MGRLLDSDAARGLLATRGGNYRKDLPAVVAIARELQSNWGDVQFGPDLGLYEGIPVTVVVRRLTEVTEEGGE